MSLTAKVFRSSTLNLVEHFVQIAVVFFVTPLMVSQLGETQYGVWLISMAIIGYYKLLDLGITLAGSRFLARSIGADDQQDYQINISTLLTIYRRIGLITIPLVLIVAFAAPHFIKSNDYTDSIRWILLAFGLNVAIRFFTRIFPVILRSHVRYDFIVISSLSKTLIQGGLMIYFLLHDAGLTTLIIIHICADLIDQLLLFLFARRIDNTVAITTRHYQADRAHEIMRYGFSSFLARAGNSLRTGIDPLIIGSVNGLAKVPVFSIGNRFLSIFNDVINALFGGHLLAALSQTEARHGIDSVRSNFLKAIRLSVPIAVLAGCSLAIYAPLFIERWVGSNFMDSGSVLLILIAPYVVRQAQYPAISLFYSANRQHYIAWLGLGGGILNIILSLILSHKIGFFGVIWGTFIELTLVYLFIFPVLVARTLEIPVTSYLTSLLPGFLKAGIPSLFWFLLIRHVVRPDYINLFLLASGHAAITFTILWFTVLSKQERKYLLTMFRPNA